MMTVIILVIRAVFPRNTIFYLSHFNTVKHPQKKVGNVFRIKTVNFIFCGKASNNLFDLSHLDQSLGFL